MLIYFPQLLAISLISYLDSKPVKLVRSYYTIWPEVCAHLTIIPFFWYIFPKSFYTKLEEVVQHHRFPSLDLRGRINDVYKARSIRTWCAKKYGVLNPDLNSTEYLWNELELQIYLRPPRLTSVHDLTTARVTI